MCFLRHIVYVPVENYWLCFYTHKVFMSIRIVESLIRMCLSLVTYACRRIKSYKKVSGSCELSRHSTTRTRKSQEDRHKTSQSRIKSRREPTRIRISLDEIHTRIHHIIISLDENAREYIIHLDEIHKHIISFEIIYTGVYLDTILRIVEICAIIHIHSGTPYVRRLRLRLYIYDRIRRDRRRTRRRLCAGLTRLSGYGIQTLRMMIV